MILLTQKRKSRKLPIAVFILFFISLFVFFPATVSVKADVSEPAQDAALEENIREQLDKLDLTALQSYLDSLKNTSKKDVKDALFEYISGRNINYQSFGKEILLILFSKVTEIFPYFACIIAVTLLSGLLSSMQDGLTQGSSVKTVRLIAYASALIPLITISSECISETIKGITSMQKQMGAIYPIMMTLLAACGNTVTVSVCRPAVGFFATAISTILCEIVMPLTLVIMVFSFISNFTKTLKIEKFTAFFKSINKWIVGVSISVFGLFFTLQGITAASYDGVVRRAAKYAIGNGVPIIGGFLSGGFDLAVAGGVLIKNALGSMGIFLMISVLLEPIILLISVGILLRLTAAIAQPLGDGEISGVLAQTADNLNYCTACLLFVGFLYFLTIVIMICCTETIF